MVATACGTDSARVTFATYQAVEPYTLEMSRPCLVAIIIVSRQTILYGIGGGNVHDHLTILS